LEVKSAGGGGFGPDGERLAFLSNWSGTTQLYVVSREGGQPEQLTDFEDGVSFGTFSPVNNEIFFGMSEGGNERTQLYMYELDRKTIRRLTDNSEAIYRGGGCSRDGEWVGYASNERNGKDFDVYVMELKTG